MKNWVCIAGKRILIEDSGEDAMRFFRGFEAEQGDAFMRFRAVRDGGEVSSGSAEEELLFGIRMSRQSGAYAFRFDARPGTGEYLLASEDFTDCRLVSEPFITGEMPEDSAGEPRWKGLILGAIAAKGAFSDMLLVHASAVEYGGGAVIFTAPSGTGKTTQAELWEKFRGARILNGDKVFISRKGEVFHAWGSPWAGSSPYRVNRGAPLRAVVVLEKGQKNSIRRLADDEAMEQFVPNIFLPYWEAEVLTAALGALARLLAEIPVYHLICRPDEEAVLLAESSIFGDRLRI